MYNTLMTKLGVTGTHHGCTPAQLNRLTTYILGLTPEELHEGDCIGVDAQAAAIAMAFGIYTVAHPPDNPRRRAYAPASEVRTEKPYLKRDHDIVDETDILLGVPHTPNEIIRSGTWATIRYAVIKMKKVFLILPSGEFVVYNKGRQQ